MDKSKIFDTLGIAATRDTNIIKKAYRGKLVQVNPEDDPEGFKLLREAYEEAVRLAGVEEEDEPSETPDTPVGRWIKKVEEVYSRLSSRTDLACWEELFENEVCRDFDTCSEAREALLGFLMDNFRLPAEVWRLIEDTFQLVDSKEELYEKFPVEFVNYVTGDAESKGWIDLSLFQGDDHADIDGFINLYLSLRRLNDSGKYDGAEEVFEKLEEINLWHPYLEGEKIRYFLEHKRLEEAKEVAEDLRRRGCGELYAKYYAAKLYLECRDLENAYAECTSILEVNPDYFGAKAILCAYYLEKEEYKLAKEKYLELLEINNYDESLHEGLQMANVGLMKGLREQLEKEPDNKTLKMELAWCLYQNRLFDQCITLTGGLDVDDEIYYDYNNLMGRTYLELEDYEKGFPCVTRWLAEIKKTEDDGTKEMRKRLQRLGLAYYLMAICYHHFGKAKEDKKEDFNESIKYLDLAAEAEGNLGARLQYMSLKAQVFLELQEEKTCVDVCDEILKIDKGYFPAYLIRQEAYFNLRMAQEVIDDYYNAVDLYAGNPSPYIFAARVYLIYKQCDDASALFKRAKEAGVESNELLFLELKNKRLMAETNEERKKVAVELEKLYAKAQKEPGDLKEITDLLHEQALCYYHMDENEMALKVIDKKLDLKISYDSMVLKGDILYYMEEYTKSIEVLEEVLGANPEDTDVCYKLGLNYSALGKEGDALESFQKVLKNDPEHQYVNSELMEIYKRRYLKNYKQTDYNTALDYAKRQIEVNPNGYSYTDLGLMYLEAYRMEEGIKAFEEAIKHDDTNAYPYNNIGYAYKVLGEFEKAYEYYKLSAQRIGSDDLLPYWNMAVCFRSLGQYEKALETYRLIVDEGGDPLSVNEKIMDVYKQMGAWEQALQQAKKLMELREDGQMSYLLDSGDICSFAGRGAEALAFYKEAIKKCSKKSKPYINIGNYILWAERNKKKALRYYMKAYKVAKKHDSDSEEDALKGILSALKELGKEKKGVRYLEEIYRLHNNWYGSVEESLNNPELRKVRLYYLAVWNYDIGLYDEAQRYMNLMKEALNCTQCTYCTCFEYLELEGMMLELQKDYAGALQKYQRALEVAPDNLHFISKIKELKRKAEAR